MTGLDRPHPLLWLWPAALGVAAILAAAAPASLSASAIHGPHWLLAALAFWAQRRPASTPPLLVFSLGLTHDLLTDGPVGAELFALLALVEGLRLLAERAPPRGFVSEWARLAIAALLLDLIVRGFLAVTLAPTPDWSASAERLGATIAIYPALAIVVARVSGARRVDARFAHLAR